MNIIKNKARALLVLMLSAVMLLAGTISVQAADSSAISDDIKTAISQYASSVIESLFTADDETLAGYRGQGDFTQVAVDAVMDEKEELGAFQGVKGTTVSTADDQILSTTEVEFANYNAEIQIYFDQGDQLQPVNFVINPEYPLGLKMEQAAGNMVTGLILVFFMLIFLAFIIYLFRYVDKGEKKEEKPAAPAPVKTAPAPAAEPVSSSKKEEEEIAAAIAAAIAMAQEEQPSADGYYVRSIHMHRPGKKWTRV